MTDPDQFPAPLTTGRLARLKSLRAETKPPDTITLNLATLRLPRDVKPTVSKRRGVAGAYDVRVVLRGSELGRRAPFETLPVERVTERNLARRPRDVSPEGMRPPYLPVAFRPGKVPLGLRDRAAPPADFDYRRKGELLDRPTNVFPPDQRYIYDDTSFPWCTVGRVDTPLGTCTGCTIGARLLLTGDHCIQWNSDGTAGWVRFRPAYYNGSAPFGEAWATRVIFWQKNTPGDGLSDQETAFDYVVCVLDTTMGDVVGYPGYRSYSDDWNDGSYWQHMGYPVDLSGTERPAFQGGCVISSVGTKSTAGQTGYVLGHFNDVVPGHSGGPVWGWWADEPWPRVVGTQSTEAKTPAMNTSGDNEFGGGPALSSLITWARSNYP